jgi:uncharacterized membrane protein YbhN (UPF0104 family)
MKLSVAQRRWARAAVVIPLFVLAGVLLWWRGPDWHAVGDAFTVVAWWWVVAAIALNLLSVIFRSLSWNTVIKQALPPPRPSFLLVFSAFCVGLFANVVLPARAGELARVAVLSRRLPGREGVWATLVGTVFAHRVFDLIPALILIAYVFATAKIPSWAVTSLAIVASVGVVLFGVALVTARRHQRSVLEDAGPVRRLVTMARYGLGVMHEPGAAATAILFQCLAWLSQLFAVYVAMRAFDIHAPLPAAGLVLVLMNIAIIFPLWPGNFGLVQAAVALPLRQYGVSYAKGFAFGIGLQAIEASVGVGIGLVFLAREGLSFAVLRRMEEEGEAEADEIVEEEERRADRRRAGVA